MATPVPPPLPPETPKPPTPTWVWWAGGGIAVLLIGLLAAGAISVLRSPTFLYGEDTGNPVATVLEDWMENGGDLAEKLGEMGEPTADDRRDIYAMSTAIKKLATGGEDERAAGVGQIAELIVGSPSEEARAAFDELVGPPVSRWATELHRKGGGNSEAQLDGIFYVMHATAWNASPGAGENLVMLASSGFAPDDGRWWDLFRAMEPGEETFENMMEGFRKNPPSGEVGRALLGRAGRAKLDSGWDGKHPYDTESGASRLRAWLGSGDEASFDAAVALAFCSAGVRGPLLPVGLAHPDPDVQIEAAWAELEADREDPAQAAIDRLVEGCLNLKEATICMEYLTDTGHETAVPETAKDPGWVAKARMVRWLLHPDGLGTAPTTIAVYDTREIVWPPNIDEAVAPEPERVTIVEFTYPGEEEGTSDTGYGYVHGNQAWSSFTNYESPPPAETLYAEQCALELTWQLEKGDDGEVSPGQATERLRTANPDGGF